MRLRRCLLIALAVASVLTPAAEAKVKLKTYCNLLPKGQGDGHASAQWAFVQSNALHITGGDVATGKGEMIVKLNLSTMDTSNDTWIKIGTYGWLFQTMAGGVTYTFTYDRKGQYTNGGGESWGAVINGESRPLKYNKVVGNTIWWKVDRKNLKELNKKPGQIFGNIHAYSTYSGNTADTAIAANTVKYPDKGLSCLKPV